MPSQFVVPQFLDVEAKIIGPISARQFIILLAVSLTLAILYKLLLFETFLFVGLPLLGLGVVFAFIKINAQPFHFFLLNLLQTLRRPSWRVWDKELASEEIKNFLKEELPEASPMPPLKEPLLTSRLEELSLVVNTGGVYKKSEIGSQK
jgi:hypothetical protein